MKAVFEDIFPHAFHYLILGLVLLIGLAVLAHYSFSDEFRFFLVIALAYLYILWGVFHHLTAHKHLSLTIVVEYVLVALVGVVLARGIFGIR